MRIVSRTIFLLMVSLLVVGLNSSAFANNKGTDKKPKKCPTVWCPKVKYVCKPCKKGKKPPTSTCNPRDICCSFEIVGWYDCTPKNGKCSAPNVHDNPWQIEDDDQSRDDGRDDRNDRDDHGRR